MGENLLMAWKMFSLSGIKRKYGFINTADMMINSWRRLIKELIVREINYDFKIPLKEFLNRFINKCLKITNDGTEEFEGKIEIIIEFTIMNGKEPGSIFESLGKLALLCYDIMIQLMNEKINSCILMYKNKQGIAKKLEDQLGWLIQAIASMTKIKLTNPMVHLDHIVRANSDTEEFNIYANVLNFMKFTSSFYTQNYFISLNLEYSYLSFIDSLRKGITTSYYLVCEMSTRLYDIFKVQLQISNFEDTIDLLAQKLYKTK